MKFKKTVLKNGLRVITIPTKGNPSATVLVMAETGSNYETKEENGLSHFLEHMCFKGTPKRPSALDVSIEVDSLGAANNAYTNIEYTGYYAKGAKRHWKKLLDIVSDIYINPVLPEVELEKERGVILQEISMYEDLPQWKVQEVFEELLHGDTPAGRPILGPAENIKRFTRQDFIDYKEKHYIASGTIVVVAGDLEPQEVEGLVEKLFRKISDAKKHRKEKVEDKQKAPALLISKKKTDQTHVVLGFRSYPAGDKRSISLEVLAGVLGGGMSSRLFQKLREEMGACYYVRTSSNQATDHGDFTISTGIEKKRVEEVEKVLINECRRLKEELVPEKELEKTKDYLIGNLSMSLETTSALAQFFASEEVSHGSPKTIKEMEAEIRAVTAKDVQKVARAIFKNEGLNMAIVGDIENSAKVKKLLRF